MKTKILPIIIIIILLPLCLNAIEFNYEKINDFAIGGNYDGDGKIIVEFPYMYAASRYGLEIMNIDVETGDLQRISTLGLTGWAHSITKKSNFVYVATWLDTKQIGTTDLYKIDVSNPENPLITDSISMDNNYEISSLNFYNDHLIYHKLEANDTTGLYYYTELVFLNDETLQEITSFPIINRTNPINDTLFVAYDGLPWNTFSLYDFSDLNNITLIANIDLTASAFEGGFIQQIDENTIGRAANEGISFWDISDIQNWQLITDFYTVILCTKFGGFTKVGDYIIVPQQAAGIEAINISNIQNPYSTYFWEFPEDLMYPYFMNFSNIVNWNNYLYLGTSDKGIYKFTFINGIIEYENSYIYNPRYYCNNKIYNNYLFTSTFTDGVYVYDISNVDNPELAYTLIDSCWIRSLEINSERLFVYYNDRETYLDRFAIFNISNTGNPQLLSDILIPGINKAVIFNENEPDAFYIHYCSDIPKVVKYDITNPLEPQIILEYTLPVESWLGFFYEGYFYFIEYAQSFQDLYIYSGLEDNVPELASQINNFGPDYQIIIRKVENYLQQFTIFYNYPDKFYEFETPVDIVEKFTIDNSSGGFYSYIHNNILFSPNFYTVRLYDLSDNPTGQLTYFDYFNGFSGYYSVNFYTQNDQKYFFNVQDECISTYEYTINAISEEEINPSANFSLSNYPNPFSTSTTISFFATDLHGLTKVKIYNIKGQLVKCLECGESLSTKAPMYRDYSINWDGTDENGKQLPNGIYFYKLSTKDKTIVKKMIILK